ncbi:hypothetical protein ACXEGP_002413 [Klebsiella quasipneumoniae]
MTSREQFEAWVRNQFKVREVFDESLLEIMPCKCCYKTPDILLAWDSWKASRDEIEIELPSIEDKKWYSSWHGKFREEAFWLEVKRRLVELGLKVKGG